MAMAKKEEKVDYRVEVIRVEDIDVSDRYREDFGNIEELMDSIKEKGVLQPITVTAIEGARKGQKQYKLLAGERRWTSCFNLKIENIPALIRDWVDEIDAREVELMENIHRKEMTWQEQAKLTARIHTLYTERDANWSQRKTAQLIEQSPMNVTRALRLAAGMESLPDLEKCKSADEAGKVIKKAEENAIVAELARRQQHLVLDVQEGKKTGTKDKGVANTLRVANEDYRIGDVFQGMAQLRTNGHIDFIECDPPYGVDLDILTQRDGQTNVNLRDATYHEINEGAYTDFVSTLSDELYRVAGKDCWMVFWFAFKWMGAVRTALLDSGWTIDEVPALWIKGNGRTPRPDLLLARSYEPFFVCRKGQPTVIKQGRMNAYTRNADEKKYHPAQRPVGLMEDIIQTFLDEGHGNVFIPFLGSGATLRACYKMGKHGFGFDTNEEYKNHFLLAVEEDTKRLLAKE